MTLSLFLSNQLDVRRSQMALRVYEGSTLDALSCLLEEGCTPVSLEQIMLARMCDILPSTRWHESGSLVATNAQGYAKILPFELQTLLQIDESKIPVHEHYLKISALQFDKLPDMYTFSPAEVSRHAKFALGEREARKNPFWKSLLSDDVRDAVIQHTFSRFKRLHGTHTGMNISLAIPSTDAAIRFLGVYDIGSGSNLYGTYPVDELGCRLVGIKR